MLFFLMMVIFLAGAHVYVGRRLLVDTAPPSPLRWLGAATLIACAVATPSSFAPPGDGTDPAVRDFGQIWLGVTIVALLLALGIDALHLAARAIVHLGAVRPVPTSPGTVEAAADPERRLFLARARAATLVAGTAALGARGARAAVADVETPEVPVWIERLPRALDGFRIAHVSDVHLGRFLDGDDLARLVDRVKGLGADAIVVTGDLVDAPLADTTSMLGPLTHLTARHGVFFVTGNHECYSGPVTWMQALERAGLEVLENRRVAVGDRHPGGATFDLAGIPDPAAEGIAGLAAPDPQRTLAGRDPAQALLVLAHRPSQIRDLEGLGVDLHLAGHTHGGQMWPAGLLVRVLGEPYLSGLHRHHDGTQVLVSRGAGYVGARMRIGAPAEVPLVVLVAGSAPPVV